MRAESKEEIIEALRPHLTDVFKKPPKDVDVFLSESAIKIQQTLLADDTDNASDLKDYSDEELDSFGYVRLRRGRIVWGEDRDALKKDLNPLIRCIENLHSMTIDLLMDEGTYPDDLTKLASNCSKILSQSKKKRGNKPRAQDDKLIWGLARIYAKYIKKRPASAGANSPFIKYVNACYSTAEKVEIEAIESKVRSFNKRFPFKNTFETDGSLKRLKIRVKYK